MRSGRLSSRVSSLALLVGGSALAQGSLETRIAIEELIAQSRLDEASALAETLISEIHEEFGDQNLQLADAQFLLAELLRAQGEFLTAEDPILDAIGAIKSADGDNEIQLINALLLLADNYEALGNNQIALEAYDEARDTGRRKWGVLNLDQIEIIDRMSSAHLAAGNFEAAHQYQVEAMAITQRVFGPDSVEMIEARYGYARWLRNQLEYTTINTRDIRAIYGIVQGTIDEHYLDADPEQAVRLLHSLGRELLIGGLDWGELGLRMTLNTLWRAESLYERHELDNPLLLAQIERDLGDHSVLAGAEARINDHYRKAWDALGRLADAETLRTQWFADLNTLHAAGIDSPRLGANADDPRGHIEIAFLVDEFGRPDDVEITRSDPAGYLDLEARNWVESSIFRPQVVNGEVVESRRTIGWDYQADAERFERFNARQDESQSN